MQKGTYNALHAYLRCLEPEEVVASVGVQRVVASYATLLTPIHEVHLWLKIWNAIFKGRHAPAAPDRPQLSTLEGGSLLPRHDKTPH